MTVSGEAVIRSCRVVPPGILAFSSAKNGSAQLGPAGPGNVTPPFQPRTSGRNPLMVFITSWMRRAVAAIPDGATRITRPPRIFGVNGRSRSPFRYHDRIALVLLSDTWRSAIRPPRDQNV